MPTQTHPIDAPASPSLIAAFILILGLGVAALVIHPPSGSMQGPSTDAVAEFGD